MGRHYILETVSSARAKSQFGEVLNTAAHDHSPVLIDRYGKGAVAVLDPSQVVALVDEHFETEVIFDDDEVSVTLPQVGIIGAGPTVDAAIDDTLVKLREYATRYLKNSDFYRQTNRAHEYPLLTKFAYTPIDQQRALLLEGGEDAVSAG